MTNKTTAGIAATAVMATTQAKVLPKAWPGEEDGPEWVR
jgi:hypothetical protein